MVAVRIDPAIFDAYYNGCCNATFWPLFHSMPDRAQFRGDNWNAYTEANKEFAECTLNALRSLKQTKKEAGQDIPLVWIHDYHLMLAANWIRQVCYNFLLSGFKVLLLSVDIHLLKVM